MYNAREAKKNIRIVKTETKKERKRFREKNKMERERPWEEVRSKELHRKEKKGYF